MIQRKTNPSFDALAQAWQEATQQHEREHVTPYLRQEAKYKRSNVVHDNDLSGERWTVDDPEDFEVVSAVFEHFAPNLDFKMEDVLGLRREKPNLFLANQNIQRNEGATLGKGQKLWRRAKRIIPGGNMLLSKRSEMFLPEKWPAYFSKAKGCLVWDLDGNEYTDTSIMGIGTNILGYGHPAVDEAVRKVIDAGNMSTFNCPEEVAFAEKLVELHPWADMVRFARTGGEANAIAIRIARAASGRSQVAFCGYHGWHDWYLAANLGDDQNLDGHLLAGLAPKGVPRGLKNTVLPFNFNDYTELESLVKNNDIGVIKMEVHRNIPPATGFLEKVRALATANNIVLIFDECTSGFRQTFGGIHKLYGVDPDMAVFGKAMGNGYAITATIGKRSVMEAAQATFISSTFWTERIGPAAGLKTLEVMEETKAWEQITKIGEEIQKQWESLGAATGLAISVSGLPALASFSIKSNNWLAYKTFITQEMLKQNFLAANSIYVSTSHTPSVLSNYFEKLERIFETIKKCENDEENINDLLEVPICHGGFQRLN